MQRAVSPLSDSADCLDMSSEKGPNKQKACGEYT